MLQAADAGFVVLKHVLKPVHITPQLNAKRLDLINDGFHALLQSNAHPCVLSAELP